MYQKNLRTDYYRNQTNFRTDYGKEKHLQRELLDTKPPKKAKRLGKFDDFGIYCNHLMRQSLITGFSVLATTKSTVRRIAKLLVFLICTAGFFYQTYSFLQLYLSYPTILNIDVKHPEIITAPALTICNRNRLRRQAYCKEYPRQCVPKGSNREEFCNLYPKYCPTIETSDEVWKVIDQRKLINQNSSTEVLDILGPQSPKDLVFGCAIIGVKGNTPCRNSIPIRANKGGFPHKCFAVESLLGEPKATAKNLSINEAFSILLTLHPEEYMNPYDLIQAYVYVHDPRSVANPMAEGVTLTAGYRYKLYLTMEKRESLSAPYITNCTDYMSEWLQNRGYGPLSKRDCTEICKIKSMVEEFGCVGQTMTYPNNYTICSDKSLASSPEINEKCSDECNDACDASVYTITLEVEDNLGDLMCTEGEEHCKHNNLAIHVSFSRMSITKYKHEPKFQSVELFSYVGGYMGMWLGISLVSLFDFVEMLFDVLAYPVIKYRKSKKKVRQIEMIMQRRSVFDTYDI